MVKSVKTANTKSAYPAGDIAKVHDHLTIHVITFVILVAAFNNKNTCARKVYH
jgi:hypothetical protein